MQNSDKFWKIIDNANSFSVRGINEKNEFGWANIVNLAFAVELYIKSIMESEKGEIERGHNLKSLFGKLHNKTKDAIYHYWIQLAGENIPDNKETKQEFNDNLYACCNVFERFRYVHEWAGMQTEYDRYKKQQEKRKKDYSYNKENKKTLTPRGENLAKMFGSQTTLSMSWDDDQWDKFSSFSMNHEFNRREPYDSFIGEFEKAIKQHIKESVIPNLPKRTYDIQTSLISTTTITSPDGSTRTRNQKVIVPMNISYDNTVDLNNIFGDTIINAVPVDLDKLANDARKIIKEKFDIDIEIEFVEYINLRQKIEKLSKQYGIKTDGVLGLFIPSMNGFPPIIIVGYDRNRPIECSRIYHYELNSALDYFEAIRELGENFLKENYQYFNLYGIFNASRVATLASKMEEVKYMRENKKKSEFEEDREYVKKTFAKYQIHDIGSVFNYLGMFSAFAELECKHDDSMFALVPQAKEFVGIYNHMVGYNPTKEWYSKFKEMFDGLGAK